MPHLEWFVTMVGSAILWLSMECLRYSMSVVSEDSL